MEHQARHTEAPTDAGTDKMDIEVFPSTPLFTSVFLYTPGKTLLKRQAPFGRVNQDPDEILYSVTDKAAALLVTIHAYGERDAGEDRQKVEKREDKYRSVTNDSTRALKAVVPTTTMQPNEDLDHCIMQAKRRRSRLIALMEPVIERCYADVNL